MLYSPVSIHEALWTIRSRIASVWGSRSKRLGQSFCGYWVQKIVLPVSSRRSTISWMNALMAGPGLSMSHSSRTRSVYDQIKIKVFGREVVTFSWTR